MKDSIKQSLSFSNIVDLSFSVGSVYPDYLEVATAVVVSVTSWYNFSPCIDIALILFYILVLQEYWVQTKRRKPLKRALGGVRIVAPSISFYEQTQQNIVCCF